MLALALRQGLPHAPTMNGGLLFAAEPAKMAEEAFVRARGLKPSRIAIADQT